ncbi:MAG TPA: hypothetical protein VLJ44_14020 [Gaiellaceae bacterium]|nr:hypothetical protein [Gaiellaceae bacterium]
MRRLWLGVAAAAVVAPLPAAARTDAKPVVGVLHTGASGRISGTNQYFSYGVVLRNKSTKDAFGVKVRVFVLGDAGLVGVYLTTIPFIPAGTTFYLGNEPASMSTVQRATGVRAVIAVGGTGKASGALPPGTASPPKGGRVHGTVHNHYKRGIVTGGTKVYAVYYDRAGKVIGGDRLKGLVWSSRTIASKKSATFSARIGPAVSSARIGRIAVSLSPVLAKI